MQERHTLATAAISMFIAIACGAFGAHALKPKLECGDAGNLANRRALSNDSRTGDVGLGRTVATLIKSVSDKRLYCS